jgi:SulP family sulfate permease
MFDIHNDPKEVIVDFTESRISDMSAIDAVNKLTERYSKLGKTFSLCHLSDDCRQLLINADKVIVVNVIGDPAEKIITK